MATPTTAPAPPSEATTNGHPPPPSNSSSNLQPEGSSNPNNNTNHEEEDNLSLLPIDELISLGNKHMALKKYRDASDCFAWGVEKLVSLHHPLSPHPPLGEALLSYGDSLLLSAIEQGGVLGGGEKIPGGADGEGEASGGKKGGKGKGRGVVKGGGGGVFEFGGDEDDDEEEEEEIEEEDAEDADEPPPAQDGEEGEEGGKEDELELAFGVLDQARVVWEGIVAEREKGMKVEVDDGDKKDKGLKLNEAKLRLAKVYELLGEVEMESELFPPSTTSYLTSLLLRQSSLSPSDRNIASNYLMLALVLDQDWQDEGRRRNAATGNGNAGASGVGESGIGNALLDAAMGAVAAAAAGGSSEAEAGPSTSTSADPPTTTTSSSSSTTVNNSPILSSLKSSTQNKLKVIGEDKHLASIEFAFEAKKVMEMRLGELRRELEGPGGSKGEGEGEEEEERRKVVEVEIGEVEGLLRQVGMKIDDLQSDTSNAPLSDQDQTQNGATTSTITNNAPVNDLSAQGLVRKKKRPVEDVEQGDAEGGGKEGDKKVRVE